MIDLENLSLKELRDLRTQVDRSINGYEERKRREALAAVEEAAKEHGFSLNELTGGKKGRRSSKVSAKYANPNDPTQTWTGRGRRPLWVQDALNNGKSLEDLAI
ncbi:H-NS histone family protein [Paracoccus aerodenitrificans]|uniref:H-NS histone family protein n=1 Tax=Paracoccus aerodenitrificans TaxID=3017781 RepID=UPI0022F09499|nr:H-NS histone family protein [Paracoccus aerodenitrificans]WBU63807.1 H-NS histone family protein [Paracoccus aerodenitrificans]